jgi:excinuclease ABC subunit C
MTHAEPTTAERVEAKLETLPASPGVYLFKDDRNEVIYVGKAKSLRSRVRSYFRRSGDTRSFYEILCSHIADFDFVVTATEKEALILENNFIKQFRPRYNIRLRDEKTYISLKIDLNQPFPRIQFPKSAATRAVVEKRKQERGVLYFGPYSSAHSARETVRFVNRVFPIRKCTDATFGTRVRPCLNAQMGRCMGPCCGNTDEAAYREMLTDAILFLQGKNDEALDALRAKMRAAAEAREYERAAMIRDRIGAIERTVEKQKITADRDVDRDVFGIYREGGRVAFQAMFVRNGRLEDVDTHEFDAHDRPDAELLAEFLGRFYGQMRFTPPEILLPLEPDDRAMLEDWLGELRGTKVRLHVPQRGSKRELVEMACRNARSSFEARHTSRKRARALAESLQKQLGLRRPPSRIECVDISNLHGRVAVGSLVAFEDAAPDKARYRRFKIKTVDGSDDYAMMREVIRRRYRTKDDLPDLLLVDGGAGQVSSAAEVLDELGIDDLDLVGIAKGRSGLRDERRRQRRAPKKPGGDELTEEASDTASGGPDDCRGRRRRQEGVAPPLAASRHGQQSGPPPVSDVRNTASPSSLPAGDYFVRPGADEPIVLPGDSGELLLLERIRDEAHRFAITYHKKLRERKFLPSPLDDIPGLGPKRIAALRQHFGTLRGIEEATAEQLAEVDGISERQARIVYHHLHAE